MHQAKSIAHRKFLFSNRSVNFSSKLKRQGGRSQEAKESRIQEFASSQNPKSLGDLV
jgi:hypothetical protein